METYPTWPNLATMMFDLARRWPGRPLIRAFHDNAWHSTNWAEFARMAASCARHLRAQGVEPGDRVVICAENRLDYPVAEVALMAIRAVPVPTYTTNTVEDHVHILRELRRPRGDRVRRGNRRPHPAGGGPRGVRGSAAGNGRPALGRHARRHTAARRYRAGRGADPSHRDGLPDLHLGHRRRAAWGDAAAPLHPVELPGARSNWCDRCVSRTRSTCRICRSRTAMNTLSAISSSPPWARRSCIRAASNSWRRTC